MSGEDKKAVLILVNHDVVIYNFRLELVETLLSSGYQVHISSPYGERIDELTALGAVYHSIDINRHGVNPAADLHILYEYKRLIDEIHPVIVLGYTIKPNIYGAAAAKLAQIPFVANITGLGTAVENRGIRQCFLVLLYKAAFTDIQRVFFQNAQNERFFKNKRIAVSKHALIPGSGVNLDRYTVVPLPECGNGSEGPAVKFAFISRIMKEKGIEQYLAAAKIIKQKYSNTHFHVCGFCEDGYDGKLEEMNENGIVRYHGMIRDVAGFMGTMHCIVHPSYYPEGLSNVLLEACACGRAVITTKRSGCREAVRDGVNGYMINEKSVKELTDALQRFIRLSFKQKADMGMAGRKLAEKHFDRKMIVDIYMKEIKAAENR